MYEFDFVINTSVQESLFNFLRLIEQFNCVRTHLLTIHGLDHHHT